MTPGKSGVLKRRRGNKRKRREGEKSNDHHSL